MTNVLHIHSKIAGEYKVVLNAGTEREFSTDWMDNLVLDQGLNQIGTTGTSSYFAFVSVGTGSTAPANSQTALVTFVASQSLTSQTVTNLGSPTYAGQYTSTYVYAQGAVVGNIAELGVAPVTGGASLFSRTLIVDNTGTPSTITVTSLDQLTIYYRLTNTPVLTDVTGSVTLGGTAYGFTSRLANASSFFNTASSFIAWKGASLQASGSGSNCASYPSTSTIGAITSTPSGTSTSLSGMTQALATYTNGNFYQDVTATIGPSDGNSSGGIGALLFVFGSASISFNTGAWQYVFTTPIPKDNTKTLTMVLRYSWGR